MEAGTELSRPAALDRRRLTAARTRALHFADRVNLPLVVIVLAAFAFTARYALRVTEWVIMTDELQHVKLSLSVAQTLNPMPHVRGAPLAAYDQLYNILTAPIYGLFDMPTAFRIAHGFNALLMASTAIPVYFLCRCVVRVRGLAWLAAALSVFVPWMGMSNVLMTEVAAYPAFAWAALGIYNAVANPRPRNDVLAVASIALAIVSRTQFAFLLPILPAVVAVHEFAWSLAQPRGEPVRLRLAAGWRRILTGHRVLVFATAAGIVAFVVLKATGRIYSLLGNYGDTINGNLFPAGTARVSLELWGIVGIGLGVIPVVLSVGWAAASIARPTDKRLHAFAILLLVAGGVLTWQVSSFLLRFAGNIQDRYFFYIVPLVFVGMAAALRDLRARPIAILATAGLFAWVTTFVNLKPNAPDRPFWASPTTIFNDALTFRSNQLGNLFGHASLTARPVVVIVSVLLGVMLAIAMWQLPRRIVAVAVGVVVLVFVVNETHSTSGRFASYLAKGTVQGRDWVDTNIPAQSHAAMLLGGVNGTASNAPIILDKWSMWNIWWAAEFWNKKIDRAIRYEDDPVADNAPFAQLSVKTDPETGVLRGPSAETPYVVVSHTDVRERLAGASLRVNRASGLELLRTVSPLRLSWRTDGLPFDGGTSSKPVKIRVFAPSGGARSHILTVRMNTNSDARRAASYELSAAGLHTRGAVPIGGVKDATLSMCVRPPYTDATLNVPVRGRPMTSVHVVRITVTSAGSRCQPTTRRGAATLSTR